MYVSCLPTHHVEHSGSCRIQRLVTSQDHWKGHFGINIKWKICTLYFKWKWAGPCVSSGTKLFSAWSQKYRKSNLNSLCTWVILRIQIKSFESVFYTEYYQSNYTHSMARELFFDLNWLTSLCTYLEFIMTISTKWRLMFQAWQISEFATKSIYLRNSIQEHPYRIGPYSRVSLSLSLPWSMTGENASPGDPQEFCPSSWGGSEGKSCNIGKSTTWNGWIYSHVTS